MIYYKVQNVMTKDGQLVCLDIGANTNVQTIFGDIVKYINQNMDQSVAVTSKSPCYSVQNFPSQSGAIIKFGISFILTYSNNYSCVLDASVITAVEIQFWVVKESRVVVLGDQEKADGRTIKHAEKLKFRGVRLSAFCYEALNVE